MDQFLEVTGIDLFLHPINPKTKFDQKRIHRSRAVALQDDLLTMERTPATELPLQLLREVRRS